MLIDKISRRALFKFAGSGKDEQQVDDIAILNVALRLEHQAIAAYQAGAESKLLSDKQLEEALGNQKDHKRHRDTIINLIKRFGGQAVEPQSQYDFGTIKTAEDILQLAYKLEKGAVRAYAGNAAKLQSRVVLDAAVSIMVDETRHTTNLMLALNMPVTKHI